MTAFVQPVEHLIEMRGVGKSYQSGETTVDAVKAVDFFIDDGEFVSIMGQSGSGKSTLLAILGGLNRPSRGTTLVDSLDIYALTSEQRADFRNEYIGFIFQSFQLVPYLTVMENVLVPMAIAAIKTKVKRDMALDVLEKVQLLDKVDRLPDQLSGGEQERVAIARAIVNKPPILLADEPTGNLDTGTTSEVMEVLDRLNSDQGITIVMVTHNPETSKFAGRTILIQDGALAVSHQ